MIRRNTSDAENNLAAEFVPAIGRSGSCTCYREEQFPQRDFPKAGANSAEEVVPPYIGICSCDREELFAADFNLR